jgi:hypothetical protein
MDDRTCSTLATSDPVPALEGHSAGPDRGRELGDAVGLAHGQVHVDSCLLRCALLGDPVGEASN